MNWTRGHTIGHGSSATVSVAMSRFSGNIFAVKSTELSQSEFLQKEQNILSTLNSPYIIGCKGYDVTRENNKDMFNIMMEYMPNGTLTDEIRRHGGQLNNTLIGYYTKQIVRGLEYLHSKGIVHCDIKGRNILLGNTGAKIADFGCSRHVDPTITASTVPIGGTPMFMAPEVARGEEQKFPADIWALGCTIIEMATGGSPWTTVDNPASLLYHIAFSNQTPEIPQFLSSQARDFLLKCLSRDPKHRWSAKQLLKHPFLEESNLYSKEINQDFITSSPTSILDQGIWNTETMNDSTQTISSTNSPLQRIKELSLQSEKKEWTWDESWITVGHCREINKNDENNVACGMIAFCSNHGMKLECCSGSKELEISCIDNIFGCSTCRIQHGDVVSSLNFDRHTRVIS